MEEKKKQAELFKWKRKWEEAGRALQERLASLPSAGTANILNKLQQEMNVRQNFSPLHLSTFFLTCKVISNSNKQTNFAKFYCFTFFTIKASAKTS